MDRHGQTYIALPSVGDKKSSLVHHVINYFRPHFGRASSCKPEKQTTSHKICKMADKHEAEQ